MKTARMLAAPAIVVFAATLLAGCGDTNSGSSDDPAMSEDAMTSEDAMMEDEG
jgi:predicted small secreted protein